MGALACEAGVSPELVLATMDHESGCRNEMRDAGVRQSCRPPPSHSAWNRQRLSRDFVYNARAGVFILGKLLGETLGDQRTALFNYKAGPNWKKLPPRAQASLRTYAGAVEHLQRKYFGAGCR